MRPPQDNDHPLDPTGPIDETARIHRIAGWAFWLNLVLAVLKSVLAGLSGSLAIAASAIDSGTDAVASLVIFAGVKLSSVKTRAFPLGLYKLENVVSVIVSIFIFIAGYEILRHIFSASADVPRITGLYIGLILAGTVATFLFGRYAIAVGKKTESPTLIAEGRHRQVDVLSSVVVLVAIVFNYFDVRWQLWGMTVDRIGAALIFLFIVRAGWELLFDGMRVLLDASIDPDTLERIRRIIHDESMVADIQSLVGRNAGRFRFIQATIAMKTADLEKAHRVGERIESEIRRRIPHVEKVVIHYVPRKSDRIRVAFPVDDSAKRVSRHFGEAPLFLMADVRRKDRRIEKQWTVENPHRNVDTAKGIRVAEWLIHQKIEHAAIVEDISHKGPGYVLSSAGVAIHFVSAGKTDRAMAELISRLFAKSGEDPEETPADGDRGDAHG